MKTLGIIPARAGSKRLPRKNLQTIRGKSLVQIAVECGLAAGLDAIVVSTDSDAIWDACRDAIIPAGFQTVDRRYRPPALSTDEARSIDVVRDAADAAVGGGRQFDVTVLLQPTSPLRSPEDVRACLDMMRLGAESVISLREAVDKDEVFALGHANRMREALPARGFYVPNGAVYVLMNEVLRSGGDWWPPTLAYGYLMPQERSIDIDTEADLDAARRLGEI